MGSAASAQKQDKPVLPLQPKAQQIIQELKTDGVLKDIDQKINQEFYSLKSSQSVNLDRTKNESKIKKVKDIRSLQSLKDINVQNNENQEHFPEISHEQIQDVSICKKATKQLNPLTKKKMASDRMMISQHSRTQNVISMISSNHPDSRTSLQGRVRKCRVSKML